MYAICASVNPLLLGSGLIPSYRYYRITKSHTQSKTLESERNTERITPQFQTNLKVKVESIWSARRNGYYSTPRNRSSSEHCNLLTDWNQGGRTKSFRSSTPFTASHSERSVPSHYWLRWHSKALNNDCLTRSLNDSSRKQIITVVIEQR